MRFCPALQSSSSMPSCILVLLNADTRAAFTRAVLVSKGAAEWHERLLLTLPTMPGRQCAENPT